MENSTHYISTLPTWKFWAKMTRPLVTEEGTPVGALKMSMTQTVTLLDENGNKLVVPTLDFLAGKAKLADAEGKPLGAIKKVHAPLVDKLLGKTDTWSVVKDEVQLMYLRPRHMEHVLTDLRGKGVNVGGPKSMAYEIVKNGKTIMWMAGFTRGLNEVYDFVFEDKVSEEDRKLALVLAGYQLFNLLK